MSMVDVDISLIFPVSGPLHRTAVVDAMPFGVKAHATHLHSARTQWNTILIYFVCCASRYWICARPGVESDDGGDAVFHEILIYASGVMSAVIDSVVNLPFQSVLPESFRESIQASR